MITVLTLHSIVRWLVIAMAMVAFIRLLAGLAQRRPYDSSLRSLMTAFAALMDVQLLLGATFFIWSGVLSPSAFSIRYRWEHMVMMLIATVIAHLPAFQRNSPDGRKYAVSLTAALLTVAFIIVGISLLPGNRWLTIAGLL